MTLLLLATPLLQYWSLVVVPVLPHEAHPLAQPLAHPLADPLAHALTHPLVAHPLESLHPLEAEVHRRAVALEPHPLAALLG
jgi:hypothetical protein